MVDNFHIIKTSQNILEHIRTSQSSLKKLIQDRFQRKCEEVFSRLQGEFTTAGVYHNNILH